MIHLEVDLMKGTLMTLLEQEDLTIQDMVVALEVILDLAQEVQTLILKYILLYMMLIMGVLKKLG